MLVARFVLIYDTFHSHLSHIFARMKDGTTLSSKCARCNNRTSSALQIASNEINFFKANGNKSELSGARYFEKLSR